MTKKKGGLQKGGVQGGVMEQWLERQRTENAAKAADIAAKDAVKQAEEAKRKAADAAAVHEEAQVSLSCSAQSSCVSHFLTSFSITGFPGRG